MSRQMQVRLLFLLTALAIVLVVIRLVFAAGPGHQEPVWISASDPATAVSEPSSVAQSTTAATTSQAVSATVVSRSSVPATQPASVLRTPGMTHPDGASVPSSPSLQPTQSGSDASADITQQSGGAYGEKSAGAVWCQMPDGSRQLNLNTATQADLETLPGVGPAIAMAILAERRQLGRFTSTDDLLKVKGIGSVRHARLAPLVCVQTAAN